MPPDALLKRLSADGLVKAGGKQRTDSAHVVAAVAELNQLELARESVRAAVEALTAAHPGWVAGALHVSDWTRKYGTPLPGWNLPASKKKQDEFAVTCAKDGYALLRAVYLINVAARTARHGRGHLTLHLPEGWHHQTEWLNLFEAATGPPAPAA